MRTRGVMRWGMGTRNPSGDQPRLKPFRQAPWLWFEPARPGVFWFGGRQPVWLCVEDIQGTE